VNWPSGKKDEIKDLATDFIYTIVEGEGVKQKASFAENTPTSSSSGKKEFESR
jgi:hypothetical protein